MASFDDDNDPNAGSGDDDENEDEDMEDANDGDQDQEQEGDQDLDGGGDDDEDDDGDDDNDNDNDDDDDDDQNDPDSPSRRPSQHNHNRRSNSRDRQTANPAVVLTSPSPRAATRSPGGAGILSFIPPVRPEALTAQAYDIVPTMAAPQSTSINAITATPDMRWVFSGGTDGYVRMFNWVETANGKVPLTVAQKHPFVDSVMKAGSLLTYWENEEVTPQTPPSRSDESKWISPVYSLAAQHQAVWLLSGLESGAINLQTCRHQAGTRIHTLRGHTSAVSVLSLAQDETSVLSGSWDKTICDWDLHKGEKKRSFLGSGGQISAIEMRPLSDSPVPEVSESKSEPTNPTFSSNNADKPLTNGAFPNGISRRQSKNNDGDEDAMDSPGGSLFGDGDHGSLFGDDTGGGGGGNAYGDEDDDISRAIQDEMKEPEQDAAGDTEDTTMGGMGDGGPVQPSQSSPVPVAAPEAAGEEATAGQADTTAADDVPQNDTEQPMTVVTNGLPHSEGPFTAPPTNEDTVSSGSDLPPQSESTFLDAAIDGTLRIWDRRVAAPIATIKPYGGTAPWCTGACWSPDGNYFYAGRRGCTVDEYSIHHLGSKRSEPNRVFKFQQGSGPVYAVRAMPNKKHLIW